MGTVGPDGIPLPGTDVMTAPSGLTVLSASSAAVNLSWVDNASDEVAFIIQRCEGAGCSDFVNHMGIPIPDTTTASDDAVVPGTTYSYRVYAIRVAGVEPFGTDTSNVVEVTATD